MAQILNGKPVADQLMAEVIERAEVMKTKGIFPVFAIVSVGDDPAAAAYENSIVKAALGARFIAKQLNFVADITTEALIAEIEKLNDDLFLQGILLMRPLPAHIDEKAVCEAIAPEKDVDGVTSGSMAAVFMDTEEGYAPCTAEACMKMLDHYGIDIEGKKVTVVGRSLVIGKPVAMMAMKRNATVTVCHSRTSEEDLKAAIQNADVVIAAAGRAKMIGADLLGENQIILDVGINADEDGNLCGDVDFDAAEGKAAAITPVPGGIGSVTAAVLIAHVAEAAARTEDTIQDLVRARFS